MSSNSSIAQKREKKKKENNKCWNTHGDIGALMHCSWEMKSYRLCEK
jgi:hypothetical protein